MAERFEIVEKALLAMLEEKKYAVVTGASAGIGMHLAKGLAQRGYNLILVARREERLKQLAEDLSQQCGTQSMVLPCDLSKTKECERLMQEIGDYPIEVFINNAGFGDCCDFKDMDIDYQIKMTNVNCNALLYFSRVFFRHSTCGEPGCQSP